MKVLVVVDYQKDFVNGALGFDGADKIDKGIAAKVLAKEYDALVVTYDTHYSNYLETREGVQLPVPHCIQGTDGHKLFGETAKAVEEVEDKKYVHTIYKETFATSPADMVNLKIALQERFGETVEEVEFTGLVTNMCVVSNVVAFQGAYPNAQMVVNADLVDSFNKDLHNKTLDVLEGMQVKVVNR